MARLVLKTDDGKEIPIKKVEGITGNGIIVIRANAHYRKSDIREMQDELSKQFHREVVVLDSTFGEILSVEGGD